MLLLWVGHYFSYTWSQFDQKHLCRENVNYLCSVQNRTTFCYLNSNSFKLLIMLVLVFYEISVLEFLFLDHSGI